MVSKRNYLYNGVLYEGTITRKRIRSLILRMDAKGKTIRVSAPYGSKDKDIDAFVTKHLPKLLAKVSKYQQGDEEGHHYLFGQRLEVEFASAQEEAAYLKKMALPYLEEKVRYYEGVMGIAKPYKIRVREMKTRVGTNSSKTHTLTFATSLFHYSPEVIDSVIVHELAHDRVRNHGKSFYEVVYRFDPDYKIHHRKLSKHQYE